MFSSWPPFISSFLTASPPVGLPSSIVFFHTIANTAYHHSTMEATKEDTLSKSIVVDCEGDVILLLEDHEIQVSSKVLGLASPVFKAMFSPSFAEGRSLTSSSPSRISLTDDNLVAIVSLCQIIHYQTKSLPKEPDQSFVEQLAIVADKYDCIEALGPLSHMWLATLEAEAVVLIEDATSSTIGKLLYSAYTFDCAIAFKKITRSMIFYVGVNTLLEPLEPYQISSATQALLPEGLLGKHSPSSTRFTRS